MMRNSKRISRLEKQIAEHEIQLELEEAAIESFMDIVRAASREMSRRETERAPHD
jgi:hypothetical protein